MKTIKDNNKQLANTHAYSYKDKLLISKKKKYLRAVTKKDSIKKKKYLKRLIIMTWNSLIIVVV